ncbi:MAG: hypothetical protein JWN26_15 [Candidatus Saccharibacteria bacterium]|nr:hypothetical protein [Candidatus Saccharibacteria bacterium]
MNNFEFPIYMIIQENHARLGLPWDTSIINLNGEDVAEDCNKKVNNSGHKST